VAAAMILIVEIIVWFEIYRFLFSAVMELLTDDDSAR
jgi:hypothetical protein